MKAFGWTFLAIFVCFTGITLLGSSKPVQSQAEENRIRNLPVWTPPPPPKTAQQANLEHIEENFRKVSVGDHTSAVRSLLGAPSRIQEMRSEFSVTEYWYYPGNVQICFQNGNVQSINKY
jgi:hypothetical protein